MRPGSDHGPLRAAGVELVEGDLTSAADVRKAAAGCDVVINSAAVLGGSVQHLDEQRATNVGGAINVFEAATEHGARAVTLSTTTFFRHDSPLTEDSPVADEVGDDPYTQTKAAAYQEAMRRADDGADVVVVVSGGAFGPGLSVARAMVPTSFNRAIRGAVNGRLHDYVSYPVPWVFAEDVARAAIAAARVGAAGSTYLAFGREDAQTTAAFLNLACEVAGVPHRVADVVIDPGDEEAVARYGETLVSLAQRTFPVPWFDNTTTRRQLDYHPRPLREAMEVTMAWLRAEGQLAADR